MVWSWPWRSSPLRRLRSPTTARRSSRPARPSPDEYQGELDDKADSGAPNEQHAQHRDDDRRIDMRDTREDATMGDTGPIGTLFTFLMYGVVIVGVALAIFWIISELVKYGGDDAEIAIDAKAAAEVDLAVIERPLGDAEELAKRGEFREAIHTLLLRTLQELVRTAAVSVETCDDEYAARSSRACRCSPRRAMRLPASSRRSS